MLEFWIWTVRESKEAAMTPGILTRVTVTMELPSTEKEKVADTASLEGKINSSILGIVTLR